MHTERFQTLPIDKSADSGHYTVRSVIASDYTHLDGQTIRNLLHYSVTFIALRSDPHVLTLDVHNSTRTHTFSRSFSSMFSNKIVQPYTVHVTYTTVEIKKKGGHEIRRNELLSRLLSLHLQE